MTNFSPAIATIRTAALSDLNALSGLFNRYRVFYRQPDDPARAQCFLEQRLQRRDSVVFVAEALDRLIGFSQLYPTFSSVSAKSAWILNDLFVDADQRQRGVASALLRQALAYARDTGAAWVSLQTAPDNLAAQSLYQRFGFEQDRHYLTFTHSL